MVREGDTLHWLGFGFSLALTAVVGTFVGLSLTYGPTSRLVPLVVGVPTLVALVLVTLSYVSPTADRFVSRFNATFFDVDDELFGDEDVSYKHHGVRRSVGWTVGFAVAAYLFGFVVVTLGFVYAYLRHEGGHAARRSAAIAVATTAVLVVLFELVFATPLYPGAVPLAILDAVGL